MPQLKSPRGSTIDYEAPRAEDVPDDFGVGRRCHECGRTVSRYNPSERCWHHDAVGEQITLADLMRQAA